MKAEAFTTSAAVVAAKGITKRFDLEAGLLTVLDGVSLEANEGETVALMGPSGSGKSTLLGLLGGLDVATEGEIVVCGMHLDAMEANARARFRLENVGYVFQNFNLIPTLTATENVAAPLELLGMPWREARRKARLSLDAMGLTIHQDRYPSQMSGGEQQRVAVARATVGNKRLVLADEPTGALDGENTQIVMTLIKEAALCALVVTHDEEVAGLSDRVLRIRDGRLEKHATSDPIAVP